MMVKKGITYLILVFNLFSAVQAQVNLQTGAAQINLPIYNYQDPGNRLNTSISINYHNGNGLKVDEVSSDIGTGWDLQAGGFIQRIQNGAPDDQLQRKSYIYPTTSDPYSAQKYYPNGYLYSEFSPTDKIDNGGRFIGPPNGNQYGYGLRSYLQAFKYQADREQDYFIFNFNGRQGKFIIGKNFVAQTLEDSKLKIAFITSDLSSSNIRTTISGINITDENGIQYSFRDMQLNEIMDYNEIKIIASTTSSNVANYWQGGDAPSGNDPNIRKISKATPIGQYIVGKWYLSSITNTFTNKKIQFIYTSYNIDYFANNIPQWSSTLQQPTITMVRRKGVEKRLSNIYCSPLESINFNYSQSSRADLTSNNQLTSIAVNYNYQLVCQYNFTYGYFVKNQIKNINTLFSVEDKKWLRLCLMQVQKTSKEIVENPYQFVYNLQASGDDIVPAMFDIYSDHWGYYNINPSETFPYGTHEIGYLPGDEHHAAWGADIPGDLSKIDLYKKARGYIAGTIQSVKYPSGGSLKYDYEPNFATSNNTQVQMGGVRVKQYTLSDERDHSKDMITKYSYINQDGTSSGWGYEKGNYTQEYKNNIIWNRSANSGLLSREISGQALNSIGTSFLQNGVNNVENLISGSMSGFGYAIALDLIMSFIQSLSMPPSPTYKDYTLINIANSNTFFNQLPFQYKRVEVKQQSASQNTGKIVYEFTAPSSTYCDIDVPILSFPFSMKQRYADWAYGLLLNTSVYNSNGTLVKKNANTFVCKKNILSNASNGSQKWAAKRSEYSGSSNFPLPSQVIQNQFDDIISDVYNPITGHTELTQSVVSTYDGLTGGMVTSTTSDNIFSQSNYQLIRTTTRNSKAEIIQNNIFYPHDYNATAGIIPEVNSMPNIPIATRTILTKANGLQYQIGGSVTKFGKAPNGDVKPFQMYSLKTQAPLLNSAFDPSLLIPLNYLLDGTTIYNNNGMVAQTDKGNNIATESSLYDDANKVEIATVSGAAINDIAYTSFEAGGSGNFTFTGKPVFTTNAFTGTNAYNLNNGGITKSSLNPGKNYIVSYWSISGTSVTVNNATAVALVTRSGWTLNQHIVSGAATIAINGTGLIDELRLYPLGAKMTSYTYEPLIGKTSENDANNNLLYYEYDQLGRLTTTRDQNRNIIEQLCYNYGGQPSSCTIFSNKLSYSQTFISNNCAPNQLGSSIVYTVPIGKHNSLISQNAAEQLAINDLNLNGQDYANKKGVCQPAAQIKVCCNGSGNSWVATLTNITTGVVYNCPIPITPSYSIGASYYLPPGTYNINIHWAYLGTGSITGPTDGNHLLTFNSFNQYGTQSSFIISNVIITTTGEYSFAIPS